MTSMAGSSASTSIDTVWRRPQNGWALVCKTDSLDAERSKDRQYENQAGDKLHRKTYDPQKGEGIPQHLVEVAVVTKSQNEAGGSA